jgi:PAS domain S-box-containing protein
MHLDVRTLAVISSFLFIIQFCAMVVQHRMSRAYPGMGLWLMGSSMMAAGGVLLPLLAVRSTHALVETVIPIFVLGYAFILVAISEFTGVALRRVVVLTLYLTFLVVYCWCVWGPVHPVGRTLDLSAIVAAYCFLAVRCLWRGAWGRYGIPGQFMTGIFFLYGSVALFRFGRTLVAPVPIGDGYMPPIYVLGFLAPVVASTLWTFGFILMVNQRLQRELQEEKETLQKVFNLGPDGASIIRKEDGVLMDVNQGFLQLGGYTREEVLGRTVSSFGIWRNQEDRTLFLDTLEATGTCSNLECRLQRKDGSELFGTISANVITIHDVPHILSVVRDITEHRRVAMDRAREEAEYQQVQKAESLGRMAGAIAHHFNNQLQGVLGNLELIREAPPGVDPAHLLSGAREAAERAAKVSRLMLSYLGQTLLEREPLCLAELCRQQAAAFRAGLPSAVTLEAELPASGAVIRGDAGQLRDLLASLLTNAQESLGEAGGHLRLGLRLCPAGELPRVHIHPIHWQPEAHEYVCLEVGDSGCGIREEDQEKIFDPFFSTKFTGRGLGLPVALGTARAHGGAIAVTSNPGQGSLFQVLLPASGEALAPRAPVVAPGPPEADGGLVLLADDDEIVRVTTGALLQLMGYGVVTAKDGVEAMELFHEHRDRVRCVITDLTMPRKDGWAVLKELRQVAPALPVILASGYDQGHVRAGLEAERPHAFLRKPFGLEDLREALGQAL